MAQEFTGTDFVKELTAGTLKDCITREGMAKQKENDPDSILFAEGLDCSDWVPIPVKMIDKVEFLRNVHCKDHQHPYVRLHLKTPTDNPEAEVFSRLLTASSERGPQRVAVGSGDLPDFAAPPRVMMRARGIIRCRSWESTGEAYCEGNVLYCRTARVCTEYWSDRGLLRITSWVERGPDYECGSCH